MKRGNACGEKGRQDMALNTGTQITHCGEVMSTKGIGMQKTLFPDCWLRISFAAQKENIVFNNLLCHFNYETLSEAFDNLKANKAKGVDGVSKKIYSKNLKENLMNLIERIHNGSYKPQNKREVLIPKTDGKKMRPIAISCFEDKLVEWVTGKILECVYEPIFIRNSFGFRPNKSADGAIKAVYYSLKNNKRTNVVEIDFANFFNSIPHRKLIKIISKRVSDNRFKGLIGRFVKVGILEESGKLVIPEDGTPQGSIMSPILANIYLHYVLDEWFIGNYASYNNIIVRYADDAVFFFKREETANNFVKDLFNRVQEFGLNLNKDKTKIVDFDKDANNSFNFLGFTFYWTRKGNLKKKVLKLKTQKEILIKKIQEFYLWIKKERSIYSTKELWEKAKRKIIGHYNYYGYWMNRSKLYHYYNEAIKSLFKWLNRRSQKPSYNQESFKRKLEFDPIPTPPEPLKLKQLGWCPYVI